MLDDEVRIEALRQLVAHEFPGAVVCQTGDGYSLITIHCTGKTEIDTLSGALKTYSVMKDDAQHLRQMLDDVTADLRTQGMSRERHDSLHELLDLSSNALNGGIVTGVTPWIMVPGLTREIEELRRRVSVRLSRTAQEMKDREASRKNASTKFTRRSSGDPLAPMSFKQLLNTAP